MRYHKPRRNRFRRNDRGFGRDAFQTSKIGTNNVLNQRKPFGRNGQNPEKLLEKYNELAKEASSNGDEILSESYYQYADHFLRVIENRNSIQDNQKSNLNNSSPEKNSSDKIVLEDEKNTSSQPTQNSKEI